MDKNFLESLDLLKKYTSDKNFLESLDLLKKNTNENHGGEPNSLRGSMEDIKGFEDLQVGDTVFVKYHPRRECCFWEYGKVAEKNRPTEISLERTNLQKCDLLEWQVDEIDMVQRANEPASPMVEKFSSYIDLDFLNLKKNPFNDADEKLREVYLGLQHGVDVDRFVRPEYSATLMKEVRLYMERNMELNQHQDKEDHAEQIHDDWDHEL